MACAVDQSATVSCCASRTCHITNGAYSAARAAIVCTTPASSGIRNFIVDTIMTGRTLENPTPCIYLLESVYSFRDIQGGNWYRNVGHVITDYQID